MIAPRHFHAHWPKPDGQWRIHFLGIGGSGMSGIAEVLCTLGYSVSGSDVKASAATARLADMGVTVFIGHHAEQVVGAHVVVMSSAIADHNPELVTAREMRLPVLMRAEMLGELMRFRCGIAVAGTHGKTTTTSLLASVLAEGGLDPTFVIGGLLNSAGCHARLGGGDYLVAEADESDASFLHLKPVMAIVTNIDADHLSHYGGDFQQLRATFLRFLHQLPFYGLAVLCRDDPEIAALLPQIQRPTLCYGTHPEADVVISQIRQQAGRTQFTVQFPEAVPLALSLNHPGHHSVLNATAALTIAHQLGVQPAAMATALAHFQGVGRRFHRYGDIALPDGGTATLIDDYGHHPREATAVIEALRANWPDKRIVLAFQPHRFSRTRDLFEDFAAALSVVDGLVLTEVYAAGEKPIAGADGRSLCRAIRLRGHVEPLFAEQLSELPDLLRATLRDGDLLVTMGAGDIGGVAPKLARDGLV